MIDNRAVQETDSPRQTAASPPCVTSLGKLLNTVDDRRCPTCDRHGPMHVHLNAVHWACSHSHGLPPIGSMTPVNWRRGKGGPR